MAVSGSTNFSQTRNEVILDALSLIGCNSIGKVPSADDINVCNRFLNKMIKAWQAKGLHMWTKEEGILFLTPYVGQYDLGLDTTNFSKKDNVGTTLLTADAALGATTITVELNSDMIAGENIGIVQDDGYIFWTTIDSIPSSTQVILDDALTVAIGSSQLVFTYTDHASKPMRILDARTVSGIDRGAEGTNQTETPLTLVPYQSYWNVGMSTTTSTLPNQGVYVPKDLNGRLYIWPRPLDASKRIQITYERMIDDMDTVDNTFDFPSEWLEPLTYQLALRIGTIFGKEQKAATISSMAQTMLQNLLDWDCEVASIQIQPYYEGGGSSSYSGGEGWGR